MDNSVFYLLITIGVVITVTGIILFAIGVGADQSSKIQVFGANFENKGSSILIFLVGAIFIFISLVYYGPKTGVWQDPNTAETQENSDPPQQSNTQLQADSVQQHDQQIVSEPASADSAAVMATDTTQ